MREGAAGNCNFAGGREAFYVHHRGCRCRKRHQIVPDADLIHTAGGFRPYTSCVRKLCFF